MVSRCNNGNTIIKCDTFFAYPPHSKKNSRSFNALASVGAKCKIIDANQKQPFKAPTTATDPGPTPCCIQSQQKILVRIQTRLVTTFVFLALVFRVLGLLCCVVWCVLLCSKGTPSNGRRRHKEPRCDLFIQCVCLSAWLRPPLALLATMFHFVAARLPAERGPSRSAVPAPQAGTAAAQSPRNPLSHFQT